MIYLDNAATTKVYNEIIHLVKYYLEEMYFNPSALTSKSLEAAKVVSAARRTLADLLCCSENEIIFTGCGSEGDNMAIRGCFRAGLGNAVSSAVEHAAVYNCLNAMKARGADVRFCKTLSDGRVDVEDLLSKVDKDTRLVSVMHVNNETGAINDVAAIAASVKKIVPKCVFHSDGVQAFCKQMINLSDTAIDVYTFSGHKIHAPKGIGGAYIKKGVNIAPLIYGGQQEYGLRAGTENVAFIAAMAEAAKITVEKKLDEHYHALKHIVWEQLSAELDDVQLNSLFETTANNILNVSIANIRGEILLHMLEEEGVYIGVGSACSSKHPTSRVTDNLGLDKRFALGTVRLSFSYETSREDAAFAAQSIVTCAKKLRDRMGVRH